MKKLILATAIILGLGGIANANTTTTNTSYDDCMAKIIISQEVLPSTVIVNQPGVLTTVRFYTQDSKSVLITCSKDKMVIVQSNYQ